MENKTEVTFEITKELAVLKTNEKSGWTKEINMVSWNGAEAKLDIREWAPDHSKMSKGITLNAEEIETLKTVLEEL